MKFYQAFHSWKLATKLVSVSINLYEAFKLSEEENLL